MPRIPAGVLYNWPTGCLSSSLRLPFSLRREKAHFPYPTVDFLFPQFFEVLLRSERQAESSTVYLCNRLEHIHVLFAHRTNISFGMRPRQQNRTRQGQPSRMASWPPRPHGAVLPHHFIESCTHIWVDKLRHLFTWKYILRSDYIQNTMKARKKKLSSLF